MLSVILSAAVKVGVNPILLLSICNVETGLRNVTNYHDHQGPSYGVAQIKLSTAKMVMPNITVRKLHDPRTNVTAAALLLKRLMNKYHNQWDAVAAYNAGSLRYKKGKLINTKYVDKVKKSYYNFSKKLCLTKGKHDSNKIQNKWRTASINKTYSMQ